MFKNIKFYFSHIGVSPTVVEKNGFSSLSPPVRGGAGELLSSGSRTLKALSFPVCNCLVHDS